MRERALCDACLQNRRKNKVRCVSNKHSSIHLPVFLCARGKFFFTQNIKHTFTKDKHKILEMLMIRIDMNQIGFSLQNACVASYHDQTLHILVKAKFSFPDQSITLSMKFITVRKLNHFIKIDRTMSFFSIFQ